MILTAIISTFILSFCIFWRTCRSENSLFSFLLQYRLPDLGVIVRVTPAHLHGANQRILLKHLWAEATIHISAFLQREMRQAQHEGEDGAFAERQEEQKHEGEVWDPWDGLFEGVSDDCSAPVLTPQM